LDFYSDHQTEKGNDEEDKDRDYPSRLEAKRAEREKRDNNRFMGMKKADGESEAEENKPTRSKSRSSTKQLKVKMPKVKIVLKIIAVVAVFLNLRFLLNFMKDPISTLYHTLIVVGICVAINFIAVWILFHKSSFIRFYLSLFAILGSFGYYFYINYTNQTFLGSNLISSVLMILSVLMAVNPKVNYYLKSFILLVVPVIGIYFSGNKFALVWTLMFNAGLILFFRISKSSEKGERSRKKQEQSA
jgi:cation transport ATPase